MAKLNLQEMYLTEYNRLIVALQKHFTELKGKTKISEITDWLNARQAMTPITEIDLNKITFTGDEYQYSYGGQTIKLKKDTDLTGNNIVVGKVIEGITGTAVDGSVLEITENEVEGFLGRVGSDIDYWYYDTVNKKLSSKKGTATLSDNQTLSDLEYNEDNQEFGFKSDDENNSNYYKNFRVTVPKANITTAEDGNGWTISVGYLPESQTIQKLTNTEKEALETNLKFGSEVLGVTGSNKFIINTEIPAVEESVNHIITGQTYFRNGKTVDGRLQPLTSNNMFTYQDDDVDDTFDISGLIDDSKQTYLTIPANTYSHDELKFNISGVKAGNIKKGVNIFGIDGDAEIYDRYTGDYNIILNTEAFTSLSTKEKAVLEDFTFELGSAFNKNNIRMGKTLLGVNGEFTQQDGLLPYVSYDSTAPLLEGTYEDGSTYQYRESSHIADGHYAFIDGELIKGTNAAFVDAYTGPTNIVLNDVMPDALQTANKVVANDITFTPGAVLIPENIKVGTTILGIQGSFTEYDGSTPITPESIPMNYVGYINGEQVVGEAPTYDSIKLPATLSGYNLKNGFYKDVQVEPLKLNAFGNIFIANTSAGKQWIASYLRKGTSLFVGGSPEQGIEAESIEGTGKTILVAQDHKSASLILKNAEENEIMHYTATGSALYPQNSYWEVVTDTIVGVPNPSNIPTFDRLFRARELNGANALESDVLSGRKYYDNKGVLKTGTIPVYDRYKYSFKADNSFPKQIEGAGYYAGITVGVDTTSINPAYIKKGATLFGVTGTYEPNLTSKTVYANKTYYAADDGYEGYSEFTVDVPEPLLKPLVIENLGSQSIASKNNVYTPESPYVGFDKVTVNLQPKLYNTTVTTNGDVTVPEGYDGLGTIKVDVGPNLDTSYKVTWNDVKTGATINPSGYSGFNAIRFNTMKFEDYQILYEDLFKETIEPTGDCKAFTKITRHEDAKPTTLILTAADLVNNNNNIINGFTQREIWNQVEIDDIIETNNSFTLTSSEQEFFSSNNKLFSSIKVHADLGSYEINKNNISSDPYDIIAGSEQAPMVLGFSNIKLNVRKEIYNLTEAEILNGSPIYSGEGVLWEGITLPALTIPNYEEATAQSSHIAFGKTAVTADGTLTTGVMAPIMIEDAGITSPNSIIITRPVSNSNSFLVIEALHSYTNYPYLQMNVSKTPIILTLNNSYWYFDKSEDGSYLTSRHHLGMLSHNSNNNANIAVYETTNLLRSNTAKSKYKYNWYWHSIYRKLDETVNFNPFIGKDYSIPAPFALAGYNSKTAIWKVRTNGIFIELKPNAGYGITAERQLYTSKGELVKSISGADFNNKRAILEIESIYNEDTVDFIRSISWNSESFMWEFNSKLMTKDGNYWKYTITYDNINNPGHVIIDAPDFVIQGETDLWSGTTELISDYTLSPKRKLGVNFHDGLVTYTYFLHDSEFMSDKDISVHMYVYWQNFY